MQKEVINAFHKDYVKTHEPNLMKEFRTFAANREERKEQNLKTGHRELKMVNRSSMLTTDRKKAKKALTDLKPFHIYQKAKGASK